MISYFTVDAAGCYRGSCPFAETVHAIEACGNYRRGAPERAPAGALAPEGTEGWTVVTESPSPRTPEEVIDHLVADHDPRLLARALMTEGCEGAYYREAIAQIASVADQHENREFMTGEDERCSEAL